MLVFGWLWKHIWMSGVVFWQGLHALDVQYPSVTKPHPMFSSNQKMEAFLSISGRFACWKKNIQVQFHEFLYTSFMSQHHIPSISAISADNKLRFSPQWWIWWILPRSSKCSASNHSQYISVCLKMGYSTKIYRNSDDSYWLTIKGVPDMFRQTSLSLVNIYNLTVKMEMDKNLLRIHPNPRYGFQYRQHPNTMSTYFQKAPFFGNHQSGMGGSGVHRFIAGPETLRSQGLGGSAMPCPGVQKLNNKLVV